MDFEGVEKAFGRGGAAATAGAGVRVAAGAGAAALAPLVLGAAEASAKGGEFGIIEGRTASFFHPIVMVRTTRRSRRSSGGHGSPAVVF